MQKRVFTALAAAGFIAAMANAAQPSPSFAECAVFVVEWPKPQPAKRRIDYFTGLGFVNPRPFVAIPRPLLTRGDFVPSDFAALWSRTGQYSGGFIYLQMLMRWANKIAMEFGDKPLESLFVLSNANRPASREAISTQLFSMFPSLRDLNEVSSTATAVGLTTNQIGEVQEDALLEHLAQVEEKLSGELSPRSSLARINNLTGEELTIRLGVGSAVPQPFITFNLEGFPSKQLAPAPWLVLVHETRTGVLLGGSLPISHKLANEILNDIKLFRAAVIRLAAS